MQFSVLNAGRTLKDLLTEAGKQITSYKNEQKTTEILNEFNDPSKVFLKEDGTLKHPFELQTKFNRAMTELVSIGKVNEARTLGSLYTAGSDAALREQSNVYSRDAIVLSNPESAKAFENTNLSWVKDLSTKGMTGLTKATVAPKWYTGQKERMNNFVDPETGIEYPGWKWVQLFSNSAGETKYKVLSDANDPSVNKDYNYNHISGSTTNYHGEADNQIVRIVDKNGNERSAWTSGGKIYESKGGKEIKDYKRVYTLGSSESDIKYDQKEYSGIVKSIQDEKAAKMNSLWGSGLNPFSQNFANNLLSGITNDSQYWDLKEQVGAETFDRVINFLFPGYTPEQVIQKLKQYRTY